MKPNKIDLPVSSGLPVLTMWFICFLISVLALQMCTLNPVHINLGEVFIVVVVVWSVLFGWLASETMFLCIVLTALELSRKTRQASKPEIYVSVSAFASKVLGLTLCTKTTCFKSCFNTNNVSLVCLSSLLWA